jgi:hypothetical protein
MRSLEHTALRKVLYNFRMANCRSFGLDWGVIHVGGGGLMGVLRSDIHCNNLALMLCFCYGI